MATTQQVTHFDLSPDFDVLVRPAHGGDMLADPEGWKHYAWHVLLMCRDENMSLTWRTGTGLIEFDQNSGAPIIPDPSDIVQGIASDLELAISNPELVDFLEGFGYEDTRKGITVWAALQRQLEDAKRLFPLHIQHFIDTYRED